MTELAKSLSKLICLITVKTGEDGKMFGTVTSGMIADQLKTQFDVTLDKRKIHLEHPIRALGDHEVELRLHADVSDHAQSARREHHAAAGVPVVPAAEAKKEEPRTEKRGRRPEAAGERPHAGDRKPYAAKATEVRDRKRRPKAEKAPKAERPQRPEVRSKARLYQSLIGRLRSTGLPVGWIGSILLLALLGVQQLLGLLRRHLARRLSRCGFLLLFVGVVLRLAG